MIQQLRNHLIQEINQYEQTGDKGFLLSRVCDFLGVRL